MLNITRMVMTIILTRVTVEVLSIRGQEQENYSVNARYSRSAHLLVSNKLGASVPLSEYCQNQYAAVRKLVPFYLNLGTTDDVVQH